MMTVEPTAKRKKLNLTADIESSVPPLVVLDKLRLQQVILNFAHNAVKFTSEGKVEIGCSAKAMADFVELSIRVTDTGIGIAKSSLNDIFQPFVQADGSTSRKYEGSGLGLAICQKSADLLGGEIFVESKEGEGSTFRLIIPVELSQHAYRD
jgi:signal transduction histidine kinase